MSETPAYFRSNELLARPTTALVVIDLQQKLVPLIPGFDRLVWNIARLIDGAKILGVPVLGTEQYPKGLGSTVEQLSSRTGPLIEKLTFSCCGCEEFWSQLNALDAHQVLLCGIESHVCVQQTAIDLLAAGYRVYLAVDAISARFEIDHRYALERMNASGATLTTVESALFELCQVAGTPEFKQLSQLIRQSFAS